MKLKLFSKSHKIWFAIALLSIGQKSLAQNNESKIWTDISESSIELTGQRGCIPEHYRTLHLDGPSMQQLLKEAPLENSSGEKNGNNGLLFSMPMPDGTFSRFRIFEIYIMHPDLAAKFPSIKTYAGQGIDDGSATIRLDFTPLGFHAMILSPKGNIFIDPYCDKNIVDYICYDKKDLHRQNTFICETQSDDPFSHRGLIHSEISGQKSSGTNLRTYRLALGCTGEYAATKGGTVMGAMAGMTSTMNRVDGVYETEVAVRFVMVANNNLIVFTNTTTDGYTNNNGGNMLSENQTNCDGIIGAANYDIGHVFSTGGGGVAFLGCVCSAGSKAGGVTGLPSPVGDAFDIDYVAHEMGHQHGGNHTFNSVTSNCGGGNRSASAAYEPGSGISIMAYAGICGSDDLAAHSIAYFNTKSFDEIVNYTTASTGSTCGTNTVSGNTPPVVTSQGINYTIPISTPFVLTGAGSDANVTDTVIFSWEQFDLGTAGAWNANLGTAPLFRQFPPTFSPSRTFPKISDIINNTTTVGEILPNVARSMHFRLTARDNRMGGGGVMHPDTTVTITVVNSGGAFAVTAPNTAVSWSGGSIQAITWSVNGTSAVPINCANVKISISTDGGNTFPTVIIASTTNDGMENVTIPNIATTTGRIKVEAVGNIFFDISNVNFTITSVAGLSVITTSAIVPTSYCAGKAVSVPYTINSVANAGNIFTAQLSDSLGSFMSPVNIGTLMSTMAGTINATIPAGTAARTGYRIRVVSSNPAITGSNNGSNITVFASVGAAGVISGLTSFCAWLPPILYSVAPIANATNYTWSVPAGATITNGQGTSQITVVFPNTITTGNITVFGSNANCSGTSSSLTITVLASPAIPFANSVSGCSGTPINLSGIPAGGTFSVANPYTGPSTIFSYTVTNGNGCSASSTLASQTGTITVNPLPIVTAANVSGCSGTLIALSGMPAGGTWSVANPYTGPSTTYTHTYADGNGCTNTSAPASITVNPLPTVTAANVSGCSGTSIALSGTPVGGTWSVANPYTGPSANYTHTYTDGNGCTNTSAPASITVNPLPTVTAANVIGCSGTLIALSGMPAGGTWSVANPYTGPGTTYTHTYTDGNGCTNTSALASITVNPLPAVSFTGLAPSYIVSASFATLIGSPINGLFSGPGIFGNIFTPSVAGIGGPYTITYSATDGNGCSNTSSQQTTVTSTCIIPATPGTITTTGGSTSVCPGDNRTYTISAVAGATSYTWLPPIGATITSGQGSVSVLVNYGAGYIANDTIRVIANSSCGSSTARVLRILRNTPATPGAIAGQTYGLCNQNAIPFSVANVSGMSYTWSFSVATASIATGQGSNAVTANFGPAYVSGAIRVSASNGCGISGLRSLTVRATPSTPVSITGATAVCMNQIGVPYSITPLAATNSYTWTCPTNARINDGFVISASSSLITTATAVTVNYAATTGTVRVRGNNACGSGSYRSISITFVCRDNMNASALEVACYPQPASGLLNIAFGATEESTCTILLSDITGKKIQHLNRKTEVGNNLFNLDVSNVASGLYMLEVVNGNERHVQKIIVE